MKKTVITISLVLVMILGLNTNSFAGTEEVLKQAPDVFSEENMQETEDLKRRVKKYIESMEEREIYGKKVLPVPLKKQINDYYCGPACARMTLLYLGKDVTQSALGNQMGTTQNDGTYVYRMTNALNARLGGNKYQYVLTSALSFGEGLTYSIDKNRPVICHVMTGRLPNYQPSGHNTGHYIVAKGYYYKASGTTGSDLVYYNDPNNKSAFYGSFSTTWSKMRAAINDNAGYYIMSV